MAFKIEMQMEKQKSYTIKMQWIFYCLIPVIQYFSEVLFENIKNMAF